MLDTNNQASRVHGTQDDISAVEDVVKTYILAYRLGNINILKELHSASALIDKDGENPGSVDYAYLSRLDAYLHYSADYKVSGVCGKYAVVHIQEVPPIDHAGSISSVLTLAKNEDGRWEIVYEAWEGID